jgi:hypothetical protein
MGSWRGKQWVLVQRRMESEGGNSRDESMMMVKFIV